MRKHLSLFLAASSLCLSQDVIASSLNEDTATSSTSTQSSSSTVTPSTPTEADLKLRLIQAIGDQTGDRELFLRNHAETFQALLTHQLEEELASNHYKDALSPDTEHGKLYRSIGQNSLLANWEGENLFLPNQGLKLVPLNFPGIEEIRGLVLTGNALRVPPVLKHLKKLSRIYCNNNLLLYPPKLTGLIGLKTLMLANNKLKESPDYYDCSWLIDLSLDNNQLTTQPDALFTVEFVNYTVVPVNISFSGNPIPGAEVNRQFLAASFLCPSQDVIASSFNEDTATSSTSTQSSSSTVTPSTPTEADLKLRLIQAIGDQTGDRELFLRNHAETFLPLLSHQLEEELASNHYKDALSPDTEHGKLYRSIGQNSLLANREGKNLFLPNQGLKLVPLNFPGIEEIRGLVLTGNALRVPPVLTHLKKLSRIYCNKNLLLYPPKLTGLVGLKLITLESNKLKESPDLDDLLRLTDVYLDNNELTKQPFAPFTVEPLDLTYSGNPIPVAEVN